MREVILVGASWCGACKAMKAWFDGITMPGIILRYVDIEDAEVAYESISSLPVIIFREGHETLQKVSGAMRRNDLEHAIKSLWTIMQRVSA